MATPPVLPQAMQAAGWVVLSHEVKPLVDRLRIRNTRLTNNTIDAAIRDLTIALFPLGWTLLHYGAVPPIWTALLEKEK